MRGLDVAYFAASVDAPETNARFAESLALASNPGSGSSRTDQVRLPADTTLVILSDPSKAAARAYGVLGQSGYASRWTFYIGRNGRIAAIDKQVSAGSHGEDVAKRLASLKSEICNNSEL